MKKCKFPHGVIADFSRVEGSTRIWTCSTCKRESFWKNGWQYNGALSCRGCKAEPAIISVACSDECAAKSQEMTFAEPVTEPHP